MAISIKPNFGEAYLDRAKAKIEFNRSIVNNNNEYCFDLIQALNFNIKEADVLLEENCDG